MTSANILLYETLIGAVTWDPDRELAVFEYAPDFLNSGIEVSPLMMPLGPGRFTFPNLPRETFKGMPGLLADSLPDKFGNLLIDQWLARQGRTPQSFDPVERLCYTGVREVWWKVAWSLGWLEPLASRISNPGETPNTVR
jgi:serine/threonine-protein kinase HipA